MKTLEDVVKALREAKVRWLDPEEVDDPEDLEIEYLEFIEAALPVLETTLQPEKPDPKAIAKDFLEAGPLGFTVNVEERTPCPMCVGMGFISSSK
jgi:hypothetical protein